MFQVFDYIELDNELDETHPSRDPPSPHMFYSFGEPPWISTGIAPMFFLSQFDMVSRK